VLAARRGLGVEEQRLASPDLVEAIHWAVFAESHAPRLAELREVAEIDPPDSLTGSELTEFMQNRTRVRDEIKRVEATLYPDDEGA